MDSSLFNAIQAGLTAIEINLYSASRCPGFRAGSLERNPNTNNNTKNAITA
jgi:hypothetical protein